MLENVNIYVKIVFYCYGYTSVLGGGDLNPISLYSQIVIQPPILKGDDVNFTF